MDVTAFFQPPEILTAKRALCIQPHSDDNEIGMGGTVAALAARGERSEESSADIRRRVLDARARQAARFAGLGLRVNADIPPAYMAEFCPAASTGQAMPRAAFDRLGLTARAYDRLLRVARTAADLAGQEVIGAAQIAEALSYRTLDCMG